MTGRYNPENPFRFNQNIQPAEWVQTSLRSPGPGLCS